MNTQAGMPNPTNSAELPSSELNEKPDSLKEHRRRLQRKKEQEAEKAQSGLRDVFGLVLLLVSLAWLLTLVSYDSTDPSALYQNTSKMRPENLLGKIGANVAAYSYQIFGFGSFLFPLVGFYIGGLCLMASRVKDWFFHVIGGLTVVFVMLTFLGSFAPISLEVQTLSPGGLIGVGLWTFFSGYLNAFGTYLFLFGVSCLSVLVTTQLTVRDIGAYALKFFGWCRQRTSHVWEWIESKRDLARREQQQQRIIQRELAKIEKEQKVRTMGETEPARDRIRLRDASIKLEEPEDDDLRVSSQDLDEIIDHLPPDAPSDAPDEHFYPELAEVPHADDSSEFDVKVNPMKHEVPSKDSAQGSFSFVKEVSNDWVYPNSYFFGAPTDDMKIDENELKEKARALQDKLAEFSITGKMREIHPGPVVTTYEFAPDAGIKYSRVVGLADDLCLALGAESIRIDRMPGRSSIGMEVPNEKREVITFREMIESNSFRNSKAKLLITLGKTIDGTPFNTDLAKTPHLLIAGQTGSGKSVGINAMLCSILMRARPDEVKFIMIDPKMVEMGIYADIPHLLTPVVTDPQEAANALKWAVAEMEERYKHLAKNRFRNLDQYNKAARNAQEDDDGQPLEPLPTIVVVIDEMADLMMVARGEVEESVARLAQKSRAIGIHLILATQRPSVDIITGVIKSNLPSRLSYRVSQKNDSRIILDSNGAEKLLGRGDGLFLGPGTSRLVRIHAPFLTESEVLDLVKFLKNQGKPSYNHHILKPNVDEEFDAAGGANKKARNDDMYEKAARLVVRSGQASVSYLQRKLGLGYGRAAKLVDMMEEDGIVGPNQGSKARDILVPADYFDAIDSQLR